MRDIVNYNLTVNKQGNILFMDIIKSNDINKIIKILKEGNVNYFLTNMYQQNSLDFINKLSEKNKNHCYSIIDNQLIFEQSIKRKEILKNLMFLSNKKLHKYLRLNNRHIIKKIYECTVDDQDILNPFLLNKIYVLKKNYPNIDENLINLLFQKKSEYFFVKEFSTKSILSHLINASLFIKLLNRTNKKDLLFYEEIEKNKLSSNEIIKIKSIIKNKKIKSFKDLYKVINIFQISNKHPEINHLKKIAYLNNTTILECKILVPIRTEDFLIFSFKLNNCLINPNNFEDLIKNKKIIFFIESEDNLYCIEFLKDKKINIILKKNNFTPTYEEKMLIEKIINLIFI